MQAAKAAIRCEEGAIGLHGIYGTEEIFRSYGKNDTLCILLAGADNADDFAVVVKNGGTAITRIGSYGDLAGQGIALETCFCAHISFVINNLIAGIAKGE